MDLEAFFDRVNHDVLMGRLAKRTADRRLLKLIRHYLDAGIMANGVVLERFEGTPQGGPLSPLLANVLLDEVDKELEKRGHAFARYADDCNVYVRSKRAGERVIGALRRLFVKPRVASKALVAMKDRVRDITKRSGGRSISAVIQELRGYLVGWKNYFKLADTPRVFRDIDEWIRHRLRAIHLKQWKRGTTIFRELVKRGMRPEGPTGARRIAGNGRHWWRNSGKAINIAFPIAYSDSLGLPRLAATSTR